MTRKALLLSPELCIGCRGCQTACKEWNQLPGIKTINKGRIDNPPDLSAEVYNRISYIEIPSDTNPARWLFVSRRCMHCDDAGCMKICPAPGALFKTKEGAVAFDKDKCIGCKLCVAGCPFNVPRYDNKDKIAKCHLCSDRISEGMVPACAKTCPTGAIKFEDREALLELAKKTGYEKVYGEKDLNGLGTLYAFKEPPKVYGMEENPAMPESLVFWHNVLKPVAKWGLGISLTASILHYAVIGPKKFEDEEVRKDG